MTSRLRRKRKYGKDADTDDVTLTSGTDYLLDANAGIIQLIHKPATVATPSDMVVTYTTAAIANTKRLLDIGGLSGDGLIGSVDLVGVNEGFLWSLTVNRVRLSPDGDISLQNTDKFGQSKLKGKVFKVSSRNGILIPQRYQFYRLVQLDQAA